MFSDSVSCVSRGFSFLLPPLFTRGNPVYSFLQKRFVRKGIKIQCVVQASSFELSSRFIQIHYKKNVSKLFFLILSFTVAVGALLKLARPECEGIVQAALPGRPLHFFNYWAMSYHLMYSVFIILAY